MNKVIIITGANSGIGLECVKQFITLENSTVIGISKSINNLKLLESDRLIIKKIDVIDINAIQQYINVIKNDYEIDCLINAAGVAYNGDFTQVSHSENEEMVKVNTIGLTNMLEVILPIMRQNNRGTIINMSSLADRYPRPNTSVYAATKAYVRSLSDSLRVQNAKYNIRVINVAPALIDTPMVAKLRGSIDTINIHDFGEVIKFLYLQPQSVCIRDIVIAPTNYEG